MKTQILERLNDLKTKSGKSFEAVHDALGFATSTVHRWHKGESSPDIDQLTALVEFYGGCMKDLYADVGKQEMNATQDIEYQGASAMISSYEAQLKAKDEQRDMLQLHHEQAIEHRDKVVDYLKKQVELMQEERRESHAEIEAQRERAVNAENRADAEKKRADAEKKRADDLDNKRHSVWKVMGIICTLLSVALVIALFSNSII